MTLKLGYIYSEDKSLSYVYIMNKHAIIYSFIWTKLEISDNHAYGIFLSD